ncbi:hypothetical protein K1T71_001871 [Dendrolimus kikuchii]|uniref:Uncharacterized protein n=1 Tax=Dendrolimus kikuchii TaxID=765133 RepID=A0ACC1DFV5_9NEOP|nr:hypothetical protein K1T71_001871 [Dendrolimus kikuchii]
MCFWLITACLSLLPSNPSPAIVVVSGVPSPILQPTSAPTTTTTTTTARPPSPPPGNTTMAPMPGNMTSQSPPTMPPATMGTSAPMTGRPTGAPTMTMPTGTMMSMPTSAPTAAPSQSPSPQTTGPLPIDPRLGTTPAPSAALQAQPAEFVNQGPSFDTSIRFPRQKRDTATYKAKGFLNNISIKIGKHVIRKRQSCRCVPAGTCIPSVSTSGAGMLDIRIVTPGGNQCPTGQEYCCGSTTPANNISIPSPVACGVLQNVPTTGVTPKAGQANFGEYPWQAVILSKQNDYLAGGVLINNLNVLTVTHRLVTYVVSGTAPNVKVRLGEWDAAGTYEPVPYQEYNVQKVFTHPSYNANTLQYDITVLRLATSVPFTPTAGAAVTINRACLPPAATTSYTDQRCWVSGWGKNMFGVQGQYQQILKKVDVPIVAPGTCQAQLRTARLGPTYVLDTTSFICAGGEANKDSCTGDGGSGLVCQVNGQWVVVGLVSWGLGCAAANVSAAYVNIAGLLPWIQQQVAAP